MAHFHCLNELGEAIPVHVKSKSSKSDQLDWLDADAEEPRYAAMVHPTLTLP